MNSDRIKEIQKLTAHPESLSVYTALFQVWTESQRDLKEENEQLKQKLDEQVAYGESARLYLDSIFNIVVDRFKGDEQEPIEVHELGKLLSPNPSPELLNTIKADAVREFVVNCAAVTGKEPDSTHRMMAMEYTDKLEGKL